jgi:hypothetical protein
MVEGYGYAGSGRTGDSNGAIRHVRRAMDAGEYQWLGELEPKQLGQLDAQSFTLGRLQQVHETRRGQNYQALIEGTG